MWHSPAAVPATVSVCFTPGTYCTGALLHELYAARQTIYFQAYSFTSSKIANALVTMKKKGVDVKVILDKSQFQCGKFSQRNYLIKQGVPVWDDYQPNIAHNKIAIVDSNLVETGSFNFTNAAQRYNAENMVFIQSPEIARQFEANWWRRQHEAVLVKTLECHADAR